VDFDRLADETVGFSGAELESLTTEAGMFAIREERTTVHFEDFQAALEKIGRNEPTGGLPVAFY
jgi:proteasome regulatory subunit